jgi:zinc-ribbon domain
VDFCSHCGGSLPADATFCPSCGRRTDAPPVTPRDVPIDVQHAEPRYFGLATPVLVLGAVGVLLVLGIVLIVAGAVVPGLVALAAAVCLLPAFFAGARRWPETRVAQLGVSTAHRVRDEAGAAGESVSTWSRTGRSVVRLRKEQFRLRRERDAKVRELGVSFYSDDGRADELKAAAKALDERMASNERELQRTVAGARRQTRKGRAAVVPTEVIKPEPVEEAAAADEPLTREDAQAEGEVEPKPKPRPAAKKRQARSR